MNMSRWYILNGRQVEKCTDLLKWGEWFQTQDRQVALTKRGDVEVSTVFLGRGRESRPPRDVKLKGVVTKFSYGKFDTDPPRGGILIEFVLAGLPGVLKQAALPFRAEATERKVEKALVQALLNKAEWLKVSVTEPIFSPGSHPLVMKLLNPGGKGETIEEAMMATPQIAGMSSSVALLGPPDLGVIEGEYTEDEQ